LQADINGRSGAESAEPFSAIVTRIAFAFVFAPIVASIAFFGLTGLAVLPIVLPITGGLAVPLFFFLRKRGWLRWWHAALAGLACSSVFSMLFALASSSGWADAYGLQSAIYPFGGLGVATALLFWWVGIFRNRAFPSVPTDIPYSMVLLVPLAALAYFVQGSFHPTFFNGRIISVRGDAPVRQTTVRLSSGTIVEVPFIGDMRPTSGLVNKCWHLSRHWSTVRFHEVYSLESPFGGGGDDC
jgi:hypothetical protein